MPLHSLTSWWLLSCQVMTRYGSFWHVLKLQFFFGKIPESSWGWWFISHYLQGFFSDPRCLFGISSINSIEISWYIYIHILHYIHFVCDVILFTYILYYDYICTYKYIYMLSIRYLLTPKTTSIELSFVPQPESLKSSTWNPDLPMGFCCFFLSSLFCDKNGSSRCFFDCYKHQKKRIDPLNSFLDGRLKKNWVPPTSQTK